MNGTPPLFTEALDHHQSGRLVEAEAGYRQLLIEHPDHPRLHFLLGALLQQSNRQNEAVAYLKRSLALEPGNLIALNALGAALSDLGAMEEAEQALKTALALDPTYAKAAYNLGNLLLKMGRREEALDAFRQAIEADPAAIEPRNNLATILQSLGRGEEAIAELKEAVRLNPSHPDLYYNLGVALFEVERYHEAEAAYQKAAELSPERSEFHNNLGIALARLDRHQEAEAAYQKALALDPNFARVWNNLGMLHQECGRLDEAEKEYRQAIQLHPDNAEAHWNLALCHLLQGDFAEGFAEYEWRWKIKGKLLFTPSGGQPVWRGEPLNGRTLLLHGEQGLGDTLQFCRYAKLLAERGEKIILAVQKPLARLMASLHPAVEVIPGGEVALPAFDCHSPLLSLPHLLGGEIPSDVPYLAAEPQEIRAWEAKLPPRDGRLRVGLVWAGSRAHRGDRLRSLSFAQLAPFLSIKAHFVSLQLGEAASQAQGLIDLTSEINDFADTAALISCLDLVIGVDTAVLHLAGALNRPALMLLPFAPDWRWLLERTDSPWYPSLQLFRQKKLGDWESAIGLMTSMGVESDLVDIG
jgi:tetratricopeptide (TPR) repeat protein